MVESVSKDKCKIISDHNSERVSKNTLYLTHLL